MHQHRGRREVVAFTVSALLVPRSQQGFSNADVSVLMADNQSSKDFAHEKQTKAPEGVTTGVAAGGTIGGTLGLLAGIGALAIPGVGPFISAAGPIMGALAGLGRWRSGRTTSRRRGRRGGRCHV